MLYSLPLLSARASSCTVWCEGQNHTARLNFRYGWRRSLLLNCCRCSVAVSGVVGELTVAGSATPELHGPGSTPFFSLAYIRTAPAICRRLLRHCVRRPDSLARLMVGSRID